MAISGKRISELSQVSTFSTDALLPIDTGGTEVNSVSVEDLLKDVGKGSGFDFEGTLAEFEASVLPSDAKCLITDDSGTAPTSITAEQLNGKADIDLNNLTSLGKNFILKSIMPDYINGTVIENVPSNTWTLISNNSWVMYQFNGPYMANDYVYVSPDNGVTKYAVGWRYDDINSNTKGTSCMFMIQGGWSVMHDAENPGTIRVYPIGVN